MTPSTIDITEARNQLNRLDDRLRQDQVVHITRHGRPIFALVDIEYLSTLLETIEIVSDPEAYRLLMQSLEDIKRGRLHSHEDVKRELL